MLSLTPRRAALALAVTAAAATGALALGSGEAPKPKVTEIGYISVADFSDDRRLAGFAHDLFVGRVTGAGQTVDGEPLIETHFPVQVLKPIKGSARGSIVVSQYGGRLTATNELRVMEGDRLLEAGRTYLFATRTDTDGRRVLVPQFGDLEARDTAHEDELGRRFDAANRSAIPFP